MSLEPKRCIRTCREFLIALSTSIRFLFFLLEPGRRPCTIFLSHTSSWSSSHLEKFFRAHESRGARAEPQVLANLLAVLGCPEGLAVFLRQQERNKKTEIARARRVHCQNQVTSCAQSLAQIVFRFIAVGPRSCGFSFASVSSTT